METKDNKEGIEGDGRLTSQPRGANCAPPRSENRVITVGRETPVYLSPVLTRLEAEGFCHLNTPTPGALSSLVAQRPKSDKAAVLVYNGPGCDTARTSLLALENGHEEVPLIVVVNCANFNEYYELMSQGAYDYFGIHEGMAVIASATRWAAHTDAVSARTAAMRVRSGSDSRGPHETSAPQALPAKSNS